MSFDPTAIDPEFPFDLVAPDFALQGSSSALLVIDMQNDYLAIDEESDIGVHYPEIAASFNRRISEVVLPAIARLQEVMRSAGRPVVFTRNGAMTPNGNEMSERLRRLNNPPKIYRGSHGYEIHEAIAPLADELVIDKLTSSGFTATPLDHALRNLGVTDVVITGVFSDMCVLGTARFGSELGYRTVICDEGSGALTSRAHDEALVNHARRFGRAASVETILDELRLP